MKNTLVKYREDATLCCSLKTTCIAVSAELQTLPTLKQGTQIQDSCWSWVICFCAALANIIIVGLSYSYGILFPVFSEYFKQDKATTAWVGSAFMSASFIFGPIAANLCNRYGCRCTAISGAFGCILGLLLTSQATTIYTMFLSFSLVVGLGCCCVYTACMIIVPRVFRKRRFLTFALISLGPGLGVMVLPVLLQCFVDTLGWRKTFIVMAGITSFICLLCCTFDSTTLKNVQDSSTSLNHDDSGISNDSLDTTIFRRKRFVIFLATSCLLFLGIHNVQIYLVDFCGTLNVSAQDASILYFYIGLLSTISRIFTGYLCDSDRINPVYIYFTASIVTGSSIILLPHSSSYIHLLVFAVVYGFTEGWLCVVIGVVLLVSVSKRQRSFATGVYLAVSAAPMAAVPPFIGFLVDTLGTYAPGFYFCGISVMVSGLCSTLALFVVELSVHKPDERPNEPYTAYKPVVERMTVI